MAPFASFRGAVTNTFWGKAWGDNLERYSDYSNRLAREAASMCAAAR